MRGQIKQSLEDKEGKRGKLSKRHNKPAFPYSCYAASCYLKLLFLTLCAAALPSAQLSAAPALKPHCMLETHSRVIQCDLRYIFPAQSGSSEPSSETASDSVLSATQKNKFEIKSVSIEWQPLTSTQSQIVAPGAYTPYEAHGLDSAWMVMIIPPKYSAAGDVRALQQKRIQHLRQALSEKLFHSIASHRALGLAIASDDHAAPFKLLAPIGAKAQVLQTALSTAFASPPQMRAQTQAQTQGKGSHKPTDRSALRTSSLSPSTATIAVSAALVHLGRHPAQQKGLILIDMGEAPATGVEFSSVFRPTQNPAQAAPALGINPRPLIELANQWDIHVFTAAPKLLSQAYLKAQNVNIDDSLRSALIHGTLQHKQKAQNLQKLARESQGVHFAHVAQPASLAPFPQNFPLQAYAYLEQGGTVQFARQREKTPLKFTLKAHFANNEIAQAHVTLGSFTSPEAPQLEAGLLSQIPLWPLWAGAGLLVLFAFSGTILRVLRRLYYLLAHILIRGLRIFHSQKQDREIEPAAEKSTPGSKSNSHGPPNANKAPFYGWLILADENKTKIAINRDLLKIGRYHDNDIRLANHTIHRHHALLYVSDISEANSAAHALKDQGRSLEGVQETAERSNQGAEHSTEGAEHSTEGAERRAPHTDLADVEFIIRDLGGDDGNGVLINGQRRTQALLKDGDEITLGEVSMRFSQAAPKTLNLTAQDEISARLHHIADKQDGGNGEERRRKKFYIAGRARREEHERQAAQLS